MAPITMEELLARLLDSAADTHKQIGDLGMKLETRLHEVVTEAVDPIKARLNTLETDMVGLKEDFTRDITDLRKQLAKVNMNSSPTLEAGAVPHPVEAQATSAATSWAAVSARTTPTRPQVSSLEGSRTRQRRLYLEVAKKRKIGLDKEMIEIMEKARRTVAFFPIQAEEVNAIQKEMEESGEWGEIDTREEAMRKAITEYQVGEMKILESECAEQNITEVFAPKYADFRTVYAVFATAEEADKVLSMCLYLRHSNRVTNHVPWRARERQSALEGRAKNYRDRGFRTRITIKDSDYVLTVKSRENAGGWRPALDTENLPPFSPAQSQRPVDRNTSPNQAKGRTLRVGLRKHPRCPTSDVLEILDNKRRCQSVTSATEEVTVSDCEEEADQTDAPTSGRNMSEAGAFISIQSASAAKTKLKNLH